MRRSGKVFRRIAAAVPATLALGATLAACGGEPGGGTASTAPVPAADAFDADRAFRDLERQVAIGPRPAGSAANRRLTRVLARRLRAAGVAAVRIQRPYRNVVGTIEGAGEGYVVVGAHHDTKEGVSPDFEGANDGASGVAVVLELARSLRPPLPGPSVAIALFDAEEARGEREFLADGIRGSRQYVRFAAEGGRQGTPPLEQIRAAVIFDMVGDCELEIPLEGNSDAELYERFAEAAGGAPFEGERGPIADDHTPFLEAGVPALDVIDFSYGPGGSPGAWWHTPEDTLEKVCPGSLDAVGEAAVAAIPGLR